MKKLIILVILSLFFQFLSAQIVSLSGSGSKANPYLISNIGELKFFRDQINAQNSLYCSSDIYFKLTSNLTLFNETWEPIGKNELVTFSGNFDGSNFTISGIEYIFYNSSVTSYAGLFGVCDGAVVSNLNIECSMDNSTTTMINSCFIGGIAALVKDSTQIVNCKVSGAINNNLTTQNLAVGGVTGRLETGSFIKNCGTEISINSKSLLSNNFPNIFLSAGGIVGSSDGAATVRPEVINCYAHGNIWIEGNYQTVTVGGIAGRNCPNITNCIASGNLTGIASTGIVKVAGIAGIRGGLITNCVTLCNELTAVSTSAKGVSRITDASQAWSVISYCYANINTVMKQGESLNTLSSVEHIATDKEMDRPGGKDIDTSIALNLLNRFANKTGFADKYIIINQTTFTETEVQTIIAKYGSQSNKRVAVGLGIIVPVLNNAPATFLANLNRQLDLAKKYDIPILVKFDTEYYWDYRPDLWNWWDPTIAGYNPENKNNVEWSDWTSDAAIKICWLNWGRQIRKRPAPNLMSPAYINAWKLELTKGAQALKTWYDQLPGNKKFLLAGVVVGWESSIGSNLFYIPNGNSYLSQPEANDPQIIRNMDILPSRGVQTTGYAAVKTAGIASSGTLTEQMLTEVVRRNLENLSKTVYDLGFARDQIIVHCGGWAVNESLYSAAINPYSCPGWSFYGYAADPTKDLTAMAALAKSDAPYWAAIEWLLLGSNKTKLEWVTALQKSLSKNTRICSIYNWGQIKDNINALEAIVDMNLTKNTNDSIANTIQNRSWIMQNGKPVLDVSVSTSISNINVKSGSESFSTIYRNGILYINGNLIPGVKSIFDLRGNVVWQGLISNNQIKLKLDKGVYLFLSKKVIVY